ncbi:hypothetical protein F183_A32590 [Bryobacterales bacterium F-183]|nr:hypothetical protein F183_A32590 [Bryobacterales bacterium F-183]
MIGVAVFHLALALGAPWGEASWGGSHAGVLPVNLRVAIGVSVFVDLLLAAVCAGYVARGGGRRVVLWMVAGYFALGAVLNALSPSVIERVIWTPVAVLLMLLVASGARRV